MSLTYETITLFFMAIGALAGCAVYIGNKLQKISQKFQFYVKQTQCDQRRKSCVCSSALMDTLNKICSKLQEKHQTQH